MHEIAELADECTVFRNGRNVATYAAGTQDRRRGRRADDRPRVQSASSRPSPRAAGRRRCAARSKCATCAGATGSTTSRCALRAGEVVGLGGLDGQGQRELLLALFGVLRGVSGEVLIDGKPVRVSAPRDGQAPPHSAWR